MNSVTTEAFRQLYRQVPLERRRKIQRAFHRWRQNPQHPSLRFKKVHPMLPIYSARVDLDWSAVGVLNEGTMIWFWVGSHKSYEMMLRSL